MEVESLSTADSSQASHVSESWYNKGGSLVVPIGLWWVEYAGELEVSRAAAGALNVFATLFTAAGAEADWDMTTKIGSSSWVSIRGVDMLLRLRAGAGRQGDLLSELQDGAGVDLGDQLHGQRAEDEGEGGVWVSLIHWVRRGSRIPHPLGWG